MIAKCRSRRQRRSGHISFLFLLFFVSTIVLLVMSVIQLVCWGEGAATPTWYKVLMIGCLPITWFYVAGLLMLAGTFGIGGPLLLLEFLISNIEGQASRIGLAAWQYERREVLFVPLWLWKRGGILLGACALSALTGYLYTGQTDWVLSGAPKVVMATCGVVMVYTVLLTLFLAQFSSKPAEMPWQKFR